MDHFADDRSAERPAGLFSIGQFSRLTGLTLKAIRLYHEKGLLPPSWVDASSGYRYFAERDVERARLIAHLRELDLSLSEIEALLASYDDAGALAFLEKQLVFKGNPKSYLTELQLLVAAQ